MLQQQIKEALQFKKTQVIRKASGLLKYDYLVPAGPYEEQWDWDAFFIGVSLLSENPADAVYLKNWALNYLENVQADGFTPGLLTPLGIDKRLNHIKPFLAQGTLIASRALNDFNWILPYWDNLISSIEYRNKIGFNQKFGLAAWFDGMESGADNNVAVLNFPNYSVAATDLNAFLYREYVALAQIANRLDKEVEVQQYTTKAQVLKENIVKHLWSDEDKIFYNLNLLTGVHIKRVAYSSFVPLWAGLAEIKSGQEMVKQYLLNSAKMWSRYGIRSLSADDPAYNNVNMIKPHSNWQGPVWPIANYFFMHALLRYGFKNEALEVAEKITKLCLSDLERSGGMHENYDAETGKPLAAPDFISWNLLVGQMIDQAQMGTNPFEI